MKGMRKRLRRSSADLSPPRGGDGREAVRGGLLAWSADLFLTTDNAGALRETTPSVAVGDISPSRARKGGDQLALTLNTGLLLIVWNTTQ